MVTVPNPILSNSGKTGDVEPPVEIALMAKHRSIAVLKINRENSYRPYLSPEGGVRWIATGETRGTQRQ